MAYRDMVTNRLQPLRHFYQGNHLVVSATPDAAQAALFADGFIPAGRCMHLGTTTQSGQPAVSKLGCNTAGKIPVWLFRDSDAYSGGYPGPSAATSTGPTWADGSRGILLHFVGLEGFELATSEFDKTRTYQVGQQLKAPEYDNSNATHARTVAGIATNNSVVYGKDCIIGLVSPGVYEPLGKDRISNQAVDPDGTLMLSFYTTYRPPIEGVTDALKTAINA